MESIIIKAAIIYSIQRKIKRRKYKHRKYIRHVNIDRPISGEFHLLIRDLRALDSERYYQYFRMDSRRFDRLLSIIEPLIRHKQTHLLPISAAERLALTLRYLATGDSQQTIAISFRMGKSTVHKIIFETCEILWNVLKTDYLKLPTTQDWFQISQQFYEKWNFPLCLGAIDGKHVQIQSPSSSGSTYFNYKHYFSIVLLAVVDANYKFTLVDIGAPGEASDSGVFSRSILGNSILNSSINQPLNGILPGTEEKLPFVFVGDEGFPLKPNLMRPYPGRELNNIRRIYNYRISRARRIVENAFGILASRWRIFRRPIIASPNNAKTIVKAAIVLHNFLKTLDENENVNYAPANIIDKDNNGIINPGDWRDITANDTCFQDMASGSNTYSHTAKYVREKFAQYFSSETGGISWQNTVIQRGANPD